MSAKKPAQPRANLLNRIPQGGEVWGSEQERLLFAVQEELRRKEAEEQRAIEATRKATPNRSLKEFAQDAWPSIEPGKEFVAGWHIDAICDHLEACTRGEIRNLLINMPPRHMKPLNDNVLVSIKDGSRVPIKDIVVGDYVISDKGRPCKVVGVADQGLLPCYKIKVHSGREVIAAGDHPFLTPDGWKLVSELTKGTALAARVKGKEFDENHSGVTLEEARLAGYFIGDGCVLHGKSVITNEQIDVGLDIANCAVKTGFSCSTPKPTSKSVLNNRTCYYNISGGVKDWLKEWDMAGKSSYTKVVPENIFRANNEVVAHFIAAYFMCDGMVSKPYGKRDGKPRTDIKVEITSVSKELLEGVQHLLLRLGIFARVCSKIHQYKGEPYQSYRMTLCSQDEVAKFFQRIPFFGEKRERANQRPLPRLNFDREVHADVITSIEAVGELPCRCIEVENDHTYTANDLVCHNSSLVGVMWFCWSWTMNPTTQWIYAAYASSLSTRDSMKCRRLLESRWFKEEYGHLFQLASDSNLKNRFDNTSMGYRLATSVTGGATGEGGDFIVCFAEDVKVLTRDSDGEEKQRRIGDIVDERWQGEVLTYDHELGRREWQPILRWEKNPARPMVEVSYMEEGEEFSFDCTRDHPVWAEGRMDGREPRLCLDGARHSGSYVKAERLRNGDELSNGALITDVAQSELSPAHVYNIATANRNYFAEGALVHNCDDPIKAGEGSSPTVCSMTADWWFETMSTRGNNANTVCKVVVMQRLSAGDLSAEILKRDLGYEHLILPARFEDTPEARERITSIGFVDPRGLLPTGGDGEPLWKEHIDEKALSDLEKQIGAYGVAGQLQQRPSPRGGGLIERGWFKAVGYLPRNNYNKPVVLRAWDLAATEESMNGQKYGGQGDYTVGAKVMMESIDGGDPEVPDLKFTIIDLVRFKANPTERDKRIRETIEGDGIGVPQVFEREGGSGGKSQIFAFARNLPRHTLWEDRRAGNKQAKAHNFMSKAGLGMVSYLQSERHPAGWVNDFLEEAEKFPVGQHDDMVDAISLAINKLIEGFGFSLPMFDENGRPLATVSTAHVPEDHFRRELAGGDGGKYTGAISKTGLSPETEALYLATGTTMPHNGVVQGAMGLGHKSAPTLPAGGGDILSLDAFRAAMNGEPEAEGGAESDIAEAFVEPEATPSSSPSSSVSGPTRIGEDGLASNPLDPPVGKSGARLSAVLPLAERGLSAAMIREILGGEYPKLTTQEVEQVQCCVREGTTAPLLHFNARDRNSEAAGGLLMSA